MKTERRTRGSLEPRIFDGRSASKKETLCHGDEAVSIQFGEDRGEERGKGEEVTDVEEGREARKGRIQNIRSRVMERTCPRWIFGVVVCSVV